jgi:hypothetical protein
MTNFISISRGVSDMSGPEWGFAAPPSTPEAPIERRTGSGGSKVRRKKTGV